MARFRFDEKGGKLMPRLWLGDRVKCVALEAYRGDWIYKLIAMRLDESGSGRIWATLDPMACPKCGDIKKPLDVDISSCRLVEE